jgi:hypothetical protein
MRLTPAEKISQERGGVRGGAEAESNSTERARSKKIQVLSCYWMSFVLCGISSKTGLTLSRWKKWAMGRKKVQDDQKVVQRY